MSGSSLIFMASLGCGSAETTRTEAPAPSTTEDAVTASVETTPTESEKMNTEELVIGESAQGSLGGINVGVGNIWERDYELPDGSERTGLTARLVFGQNEGKAFVGKGSVVRIGTGQYEILSVDKPENNLGSVRFSRVEIGG